MTATATGLLVTVEGVGGSGKSTLARNLVAALVSDGYRVTPSREPGATPLGVELRKLLLDPDRKPVSWTEAFLFEADRAQTYAEVIVPALARSEIVISDRNLYGTIAYQSFGRQLSLELIDRMTDAAVAGHYPDVVFVVDVAPSIALARKVGDAEADRFDREALEFQARVREGYLFAAKRDRERAFVLDGSKSAQNVLVDSLRLLKPILEKRA